MIGCASKAFPGVYARVSSAYEWIREEVCSRSSDPPSSFDCTPVIAEQNYASEVSARAVPTLSPTKIGPRANNGPC
eukprot:CAMPEP_0201654978 /NCGR_PEP_ID=MMETSP0493-20130528/45777_1 /ASSEMBLY_ACC=CAM_ASM_000838 /TAXON_ID=420259 /ORGANISM="Thalassiosira gravida, Strain GMp14c1" /LENGTH=75 /DNA_ID=CAMNT_0048131553 /DNA_START=513 /DNA_END=737 /DNA_ORIENTATION=-